MNTTKEEIADLRRCLAAGTAWVAVHIGEAPPKFRSGHDMLRRLLDDVDELAKFIEWQEWQAKCREDTHIALESAEPDIAVRRVAELKTEVE